ncbi:hypothetical protein RDI58_011319 [Solanum bulbocastanum]|uniref:Uncharacterized protein n=1 Tax=Solanum bulbocastanum TaxID=147425 RepID=A0AAN8YKC8_SOLBU
MNYSFFFVFLKNNKSNSFILEGGEDEDPEKTFICGEETSNGSDFIGVGE